MSTTKLTRFLSYAVAIILVLVPFQALITTWPGANFGHIDLFRIWKELLFIPVAIGSLYLIYTDKKLKKWFMNSSLVIFILLFVMLQLAIGVVALSSDKVNNSALIYGLLINVRFLIFFLVCLILAIKSDWLIKHWQKLILWPAAIVIVFGLMQHFILPNNFLTHFGYGPKTIPAFQAVDLKPQFVRLQSTLRGPNPLGAYLVLILTALTALWFRQKQKLAIGAAILVGLIVLYFTYSRSAWIGTAVSCWLVVFWSLKTKKYRLWLGLGACLAALVLVSAVLIWHRNSLLENTLFHTSQTSKSSESSNAVRSQAMLDGAKTVLHQPLGGGPGTAGPASFRNNHPPRIAENYFIQIGQEVGLVGLAIFVTINFYLAAGLWAGKDRELAKIVLAAFIGLTIVNCLSHAWADDTLAYVFWGLAGLALAPSVILSKERKTKHGKTKNLLKEKTA